MSWQRCVVVAFTVFAAQARADGGPAPARHTGRSAPLPFETPLKVNGLSHADRETIDLRRVGAHFLVLGAIRDKETAEAKLHQPGQYPVQLFDTRAGKPVERVVPIAELGKRLGMPPSLLSFWWALVAYDPEAGRAAVVTQWNHKLLYVAWSLESGRFDEPVAVTPLQKDQEVRFVERSPDGAFLDVTLWRYVDPRDGMRGSVTTVLRFNLATHELTSAEHTMLTDHGGYQSPKAFFDPTHSWVALAAQIDGYRPRSVELPVRFIDLKTGKSFDVPAPLNAYTIAFDVTGGVAWMTSCSTGTIERVNLKTQKVESEKKGFGTIHSLFLSPDRQRLLVLPSNSENFYVIDAASLAVRSWAKYADVMDAPIVFPFYEKTISSSDGSWVFVTDLYGTYPQGAPAPSDHWKIALRWK